MKESDLGPSRNDDRDVLVVASSIAPTLVRLGATAVGVLVANVAIVAFFAGLVLGWKAAGAPDPKPATPIVVCETECTP